MSRFLTARRLRIYPLGALCGVVIGFVVLVATSNGLETLRGGRLGGDLPAFYTAGRIVRMGATHALYDPATQRQMQEHLLPHNPGGWLPFAYPPFVAIAYVPFTFLTFKTAYVVHTCLMAACCVFALWLLRSSLPGLGSYFWPVIAVSLTFYPIFRAVVGGQNTAVSLLCAAGTIGALRDKRDVAAGLWLGAWLFKPQLAIPVALLTCLRHPRILIGVLAGAGVYYAAAAALAGLAWPAWWLRQVPAFVQANTMLESANAVSLVEIASRLGLSAVGWVAAAAVIVFVLVKTLRRDTRPATTVGLASAAGPLVAPHAMYYDGGLALIALVSPAESGRRRVLPWLAVVWILGAAQAFGPLWPIPPVTVALIVALVICGRGLRDDSAARREPNAEPLNPL
jgi:hypothetical protein